jgi:hypothetical protein
MRRFKSLLRLAMDKGLGRNARKRPAAQTQRGEPAPGDHQDRFSRLLGDEPPTRTLQ